MKNKVLLILKGTCKAIAKYTSELTAKDPTDNLEEILNANAGEKYIGLPTEQPRGNSQKNNKDSQ